MQARLEPEEHGDFTALQHDVGEKSVENVAIAEEFCALKSLCFLLDFRLSATTR